MAVRIEINSDGVRALLREVGEKACVPLAANIAASCGEGYASDSYDVGSRIVASVYTADDEAAEDNLANNTILRNLGNGTI